MEDQLQETSIWRCLGVHSKLSKLKAHEEAQDCLGFWRYFGVLRIPIRAEHTQTTKKTSKLQFSRQATGLCTMHWKVCAHACHAHQDQTSNSPWTQGTEACAWSISENILKTQQHMQEGKHEHHHDHDGHWVIIIRITIAIFSMYQILSDLMPVADRTKSSLLLSTCIKDDPRRPTEVTEVTSPSSNMPCQTKRTQKASDCWSCLHRPWGAAKGFKMFQSHNPREICWVCTIRTYRIVATIHWCLNIGNLDWSGLVMIARLYNPQNINDLPEHQTLAHLQDLIEGHSAKGVENFQAKLGGPIIYAIRVSLSFLQSLHMVHGL